MEQRLRGQGDVQLLMASVLTGLTGAGFILVVQRHLGLTEFSPIAQLWSIWSIAAASLTFAYQQWAISIQLSRTTGYVAALRGRPLQLLTVSVVAVGLATALLRSTLFDTPSMFWPVASALVVLGTILGGMTRGVLAAGHRNTALAVAISGENVVRFVLAIGLVAIAADRWWFGAALLAGFCIVGLLALRPTSEGLPVRSGSNGSSTLGAAVVAGFLAHAALAGPPILSAFNGGSAATVSTMFVVLTAVRLPHLLLQAGAPRYGVIVQRWADGGEIEVLHRARAWVAGIGVTVAIVAGVIGSVLGDLVVGGIFAIRGEVSGSTYGFITAAAVLSVTATLATVQLIAEERNRMVVAFWAVPLGFATVVAVVLRVTELGEISVGLMALHLVVLACLTAWPMRSAKTVAPASR